LKTADQTEPSVSIVIVSLGGLAELGLPMPGILAQTIADQIELIIVARAGTVSEADLLSLSGLQSVRLVEKPVITNRGLDAAAGIAVATAAFIGLHENHTRAEPETYERLLAAFRADDAALAPVMYPANGEMPWGQAMYAVAHHHASPPNTAEPISQLVLHHGLYRTELVRPFGERMKNEPRVQTELIDAGYHLRYVPQTVVWHLNDARPRCVAKLVFALGRVYGFGRQREFSVFHRIARLLASPAIVGLHVLRCARIAKRQAFTRRRFVRCLPNVIFAGSVFGIGEVIGYFDTKSVWLDDHELTEFDVLGRLAGREPAMRWLREVVHSLPADMP